MNVNEIYIKNKKIFRVIEIDSNKVLVIDCVSRNMPLWISNNYLGDFENISEEQLLSILRIKFVDELKLSNEAKKQIQETYNLISPILLYLKDVYDRTEIIEFISKKNNISKQTIRKYLCLYLVFQDKRCLLKNQQTHIKELTVDEKNFRWALNKYFYNSAKRSLHCSYLYLLREKYTDENGNLKIDYPPFNRFKYYYYKTRRIDNFYISREGRYKYDREYKPLLNDSRSYFKSVGYGECDSTIGDIYLVSDDRTRVIGRPIITAMVCPYSSLLLGYSIGLEGGLVSLESLLENVNSDKVEFAKQYDVNITSECWPTYGLPAKLITDRGKEYLSESFSQITDLGIEIINLKPYSPTDKSLVERFFGIIQGYFKQYLFNSGVIRDDYRERGCPDYRKKSKLTLNDFKRIFLLCVIHYNSKRIVNLPYDSLQVKPFANSLFEYSYKSCKDNFVQVSNEHLKLTLLPRTKGVFKRNGLIVNGLRYRALNYVNDFLRGGEVVVAYNPFNVGYIYLYKKGDYFRFELIDSFFEGKTLEEAKKVISDKISNERAYQTSSIQSEIELGKAIDDIVSTTKVENVSIEGIREARKEEIKIEKIKRGTK